MINNALLGVIASASAVAAVPSDCDPYFGSVVSLGLFEGAPGATTIPDEIGGNYSLLGSTALTNITSKWGATSLNLTVVGAGASKSIALGSAAYTIELWINLASATGTNQIVCSWGPGYALYYRAAAPARLFLFNGSSNVAEANFSPYGGWRFVQIVREFGGDTVVYFDAVERIRYAGLGADMSSASSFGIGHYSGQKMDGYVGGFRATADVARAAVIPDAQFPTTGC